MGFLKIDLSAFLWLEKTFLFPLPILFIVVCHVITKMLTINVDQEKTRQMAIVVND